MEEKRCHGPCGQSLPATPSFFRRARQNKDDLDTYCKECRSEKQRAYRSRPEVKERLREKRKIYDKTYLSRPGVKERDDAHRKEYRRRPDVKRHVAARARARYRRPDIQEMLMSHATRKRRQAYHKVYRVAYRSRPEVKERYRAHTTNRRARQRTVAGNYTAQQIQGLLEKQHHYCYYCRKKFQKVGVKYIYHVDHTFPISRVAGTDIPANDISYIVLTCPSCNTKKRDKFPWEFPEGGRLL